MSIIDADGLFNGKRLRRCSNLARLYWPYLFLGSNGFGRFEVNYTRIVGRCFATFRPLPTEAELEGYIREYCGNNLLFVWNHESQLWAQWDAKPGSLPRYKTAADRRTPSPPEPAWREWLRTYRRGNEEVPKNSTSPGNLAASILPRVMQGPATDNPVNSGTAACIEAGTDTLPGVGVGPGVGTTLLTLSSERERLLDMPDTNPDVRPQGPKAEIDRWFDQEFWPVVWKRVGKEAARRAAHQITKTPEIRSRIIAAVHKQTPIFLQRVDQFRPYPATWLNGGRYDDEEGLAPSAESDYPEL